MQNKQQKVEELLSQFNKDDVFLAPMADVNDFAFRKLCREKGDVKLCWTGFVTAHQWVNTDDESKKRDIFYTDGKESNLVCQILGNDEKELIATAKYLENYCDMIDLNLGCTHCFASKTKCGFYMTINRKERSKTIEVVKSLSQALEKPLSVKFRAIPDDKGNTSIEETVSFAKELEKAGANLLTVHGRTKRSDKHGDVDIELISRVVKAVSIPVIANGGIKTKKDALELIEKTGAVNAMAAQCFVTNPMCLVNSNMSANEISKKYLEYAQESNESIHHAKKHLFSFFSSQISDNPEQAKAIKEARTFEDLLCLCNEY